MLYIYENAVMKKYIRYKNSFHKKESTLATDFYKLQIFI